MDIQKTADEIRPLIYEAGKIAMKYFKQVDVEQKPDQSYVTAADRDIEDFLREEIHKRFPDHFFYGEESGHHNLQNTEYIWACDPIDGTAPFVYELPVWCISLGLIQRGKRRIGFIYMPAIDEMYWAVEGQGAYRNTKRIHVHERCDMNRKNNCILMPSKIPHAYNIDYIGRMLALGSAAANLGIVSAGKIICGLQEPIRLYDICAGAVILHEAGGVMRYLNSGEEVDLWDLINGKKTREPFVFGLEENVRQMRELMRYKPEFVK